MRLYYFTPEDYALENIEKQHLKISFANEVNDPFELMPFDFEGRKIRKAWQKAIDKHAKIQGFISFSENWGVPTMWAHYANNHKGVCYGFDISTQEGRYKIGYEPNLLRFDERALVDQTTNEKMIGYAQKTKSVDWQYENEWRQYIKLNNAEIQAKAHGVSKFFVNFSHKFSMREVILGAKSSITSSDVKNALNQSNGVKIITARASFRNFKMVAQISPKLQK